VVKIPWALLITGLPNSGKSTLAYFLVQRIIRNALVIDGDKHREMQFLGKKLGFSKEDIMENNIHVIKMAQFAQEQNMNVVIAQIAPYRDQRKQLRKSLQNYYEVHCYCPDTERESRPNFKNSDLVYEGGTYDYAINTSLFTVEQSVGNILENWK
jgi:adenylylsulfate kinase-like enzyme